MFSLQSWWVEEATGNSDWIEPILRVLFSVFFGSSSDELHLSRTHDQWNGILCLSRGASIYVICRAECMICYVILSVFSYLPNAHYTLRDYTHYTLTTIGFSAEVDKQLRDAINFSEDRNKYMYSIHIPVHCTDTSIYLYMNVYTSYWFQYNCCVYMFTVVVPDMCHWWWMRSTSRMTSYDKHEGTLVGFPRWYEQSPTSVRGLTIWWFCPTSTCQLHVGFDSSRSVRITELPICPVFMFKAEWWPSRWSGLGSYLSTQTTGHTCSLTDVWQGFHESATVENTQWRGRDSQGEQHIRPRSCVAPPFYFWPTAPSQDHPQLHDSWKPCHHSVMVCLCHGAM